MPKKIISDGGPWTQFISVRGLQMSRDRKKMETLEMRKKVMECMEEAEGLARTTSIGSYSRPKK